MTCKIIPIGHMPPSVGEPQSALVSALEQALEMARSGRLQSLVGTGFTATGERLAIWNDTHPDPYQMLGSIAWLQHEYVERQT